MPPFPANSDDPIVLDDSVDMDLEPAPPAAVDSSSTQPWVEKYRPKSVTSVKHQNATSTSLQSAIQTNQLPHLLFYGPPGTGKTSMALALTHQLYPSSLYKGRVLEMNASDERGLSTVRNKIKVRHMGADTVEEVAVVGNDDHGAVTHGQNVFQPASRVDVQVVGWLVEQQHFRIGEQRLRQQHAELPSRRDFAHGPKVLLKWNAPPPPPTSPPTPAPPYKIIILDEADTLTKDAQSALRRVIEAHSRVTRFCLICNYVTRIITPLASRCSKFRFTPLPESAIFEKLNEIIDGEALKVDEGVIPLISKLSGGDLRSAVTTLQSASQLNGKHVTKDIVLQTSGDIPESDLQPFVSSLKSSNYDSMQQSVTDLIADGWSGQLILKGLSEMVMDSEMKDLGKAEVAVKVGEADRRLIEGGEEWLVVMDVGGCVMGGFRSEN
ncbi:hypothetical protein TL16_g04427 [Triparma laevis f. inornata]|uniref:AAA+ ATPase domain-containing protein n=1 Tax=Triparma laevis f. inornata TaxID=1714386 RepID=A0A9W7E8B3_9STRA|nr:hypothetical protein TL16_g04427 [Triparma laevis f. inornata]